jgi:hypothetical protein
MIRKGAFVEFTDEWYQSYPPADTSVIKYGICQEDTERELNHPVKVMRGDGTIELAHFIHAHSWAGWCPDELLKLYEDDSLENDWDDCEPDYPFDNEDDDEDDEDIE